MNGEYLEAFALGNAAILGNVCMLPLYPGLFALLAARSEADDGRPSRVFRWLGVFVLAGVLVSMIVIGAVLYGLNRAFADALTIVLPIAYGLVALLGVAMLMDRNPLARISTTEVPILRNPLATAFAYGCLLGPLTLPCTGPLIASAFVLGSVGGSGDLMDGLTYFLVFGLGFGWPLVVIPFLAAPMQRQFTGFLTRHHRAIQIGSGLLLIGVAAFGLWVDLLPNL